MTLKNYLILMSFASIICWLVFVFIIYTIKPTATNFLGFFLFYCSLGLSIAGTFSILGFIIRFKLLKRPLAFRQVAEAFRQSFLLAVMTIIVLILSSKQLLSWLNLFLLVAGISLLEYFWVSRSRSKIIRNNNFNNQDN